MSFIEPSLYLQAPAPDFTQEKLQYFEHLLDAALAADAAPTIDYDCRYPKYEFLCFLADRKGFLLHGSNQLNLPVLEPIRTTTAKAEWQALDAVYACSDGIWPIFYAIVDRRSYTGSLYNECVRILGADGEARKLYYFALNLQMLRKRVWTTGMVYVLGGESFTRVTDFVGNPLEEWVSMTSAYPYARLSVSPEDFPFLGDVRVHSGKITERLDTAQVSSQELDLLVGKYRLGDDLILTLKRTRDSMVVEAPGYPAIPLAPESATSYALQGVPAQIVFVRNGQAEVERMILRIGGREMLARKLV